MAYNALREALKAIKPEIKASPVPSKTRLIHKERAVQFERAKQYLNGYELHWTPRTETEKPVPYLWGPTFWIQYPTKSEDILLPVGCVRASYNSDKKRVEYFKRGSDTPIRTVSDSKCDPLPVPRYFSELENVEEIFDLDLETGEITSTMKIDVLEEHVHWSLRLQEFELKQTEKGVEKRTITHRLKKYLKNLEAQRGLTIEQLAKPIPQVILNAIEYAQQKQRMYA